MAPRENGHVELFGTGRLDRVLLDAGPAPVGPVLDRIRAAVADFSSNSPPADDQTLIALRCK